MTAPGFQNLRYITPDSVIFTAESNGGPDPAANKFTLIQKNGIISLTRQEKTEDGSEAETNEDETIAIDSARCSFSKALEECQDKRLSSGVTKKPFAATCRTATRMTHHQHINFNASSRKVNTALLLPYNNGKALPSKWDDAERWISSPASGGGAVRTFQQLQQQPKSNSGPLGHPGIVLNRMFSHVEGGKELAANSPSSPDVDAKPFMTRSISIHGCSKALRQQSSLPMHQDVKHDSAEDVSDNASGAVLRRDRATQISARRHPLFSVTTPSIQPIDELQSMHSSKPEIRDVLVDERVTMTRWSKKNRSKSSGNWSSRNDADWKRKAIDAHTAGWEGPTETSKSIPKIQREEAKISTWENLQRAKAEAAIRKLEMKLEKKRSSSMEKIMKKLRCAEKKAQEMRGSMVTTNQAVHQTATARPFDRVLSLGKTRQFGCFM